MISLAFDTATERCSVAASNGNRIVHEHIDGVRLHAARLLDTIDSALTALAAGSNDIGRIISADGPGSFTGLRVGAAVAKALVWRRPVRWEVASSLLARAFALADVAPRVIVVAQDALRGEVFAGRWRVSTSESITLDSPSTYAPEDVPESWRTADHVIANGPSELIEALQACFASPIHRDARADARNLIALGGVRGGTLAVESPAAWEPQYGRPAEAQAVWERTHGIKLPDPSRPAR